MSEKNPFKEVFKRLESEIPSTDESIKYLESLTNQRLQALYKVSQQINTILDPDVLFQKVIERTVELMNAEHAVIVLRENEDLKIRISHNIDDQSERNALTFSRSVVSRVIDEVKPLYSMNALEDQQFSQFQTIHQLEILSFICVPIQIGDEVIGTIYVDNRHLANVFTEEDVEFLQAFANLMGIAIRNSLAYKKIEELNRSLEAKVNERTAELRKTIEELKTTQQRLIQTEKMASVGRLIAGFIHEFNNPINFIYSNLPHLESYCLEILSALQNALKELPNPVRQKLEATYELDFIQQDLLKIISGIREGTQRSQKIVEDLRNLSIKQSSGTDVLNWNQTLRKIIDLFERSEKRTVKIEINFEKDFYVSGNPGEFHQVITNLLMNAIDAEATHIQIFNKQFGKFLLCEIVDNGEGIDNADLGKIFDPFYTTKKVGQGIGLGLSIVYSIIHNMGGRIEVESKKGRGTKFRLFIPLAK